jgi:hypothetical protein
LLRMTSLITTPAFLRSSRVSLTAWATSGCALHTCSRLRRDRRPRGRFSTAPAPSRAEVTAGPARLARSSAAGATHLKRILRLDRLRLRTATWRASTPDLPIRFPKQIRKVSRT